jgi:hypothetical protein
LKEWIYDHDLPRLRFGLRQSSAAFECAYPCQRAGGPARAHGAFQNLAVILAPEFRIQDSSQHCHPGILADVQKNR